MKNFYDILQVSPDATQDQIKASFLSLARQFHPDVYEGDKSFAENYTSILTEAYEAINDEQKRAEYNKKIGLKLPKDNAKKQNYSSEAGIIKKSKWNRIKLFFLLLGIFAVEILVLFFVVL